jgi:hypothetical protein
MRFLSLRLTAYGSKIEWATSILVVALLFSGCMGEPNMQNDQFDEPSFEQLTGTSQPSLTPPATDMPADTAVSSVLRKHEVQLLAIEGVVGVGIQRNAIGDDVIVVYVRDQSIRSRVPGNLEGVPVETVVSGEFHAQ